MLKWVGIVVAAGVPIISTIFFAASLHSTVQSNNRTLEELKSQSEETTRKIGSNELKLKQLETLPVSFRTLNDNFGNLSMKFDKAVKSNIQHPLRYDRSQPTQLVLDPGDSLEESLGSGFDWCYFTRIRGKFAGPAEYVEIYSNEGNWFVKGTNGRKNGRKVEVAVTCIKAKQETTDQN